MSLKETVRNLIIDKESLSRQNTCLSADREKFIKDLSIVTAKYQSIREKYDGLSQESENYKNQVGSLR